MLAHILDNLLVLEQGKNLLDRLDDASYRRALRPVFNSGIGAHMRHNLDLFACFLEGLDTGCIDYGSRRRNHVLEQERHAGLAEIARVSHALRALAEAGAAAWPETLLVRREADEQAEAVRSSCERELDFLLSHTIHHYAIVAILCRLQDIEVPGNFGVAPSTLRFRERTRAEAEACVR